LDTFGPQKDLIKKGKKLAACIGSWSCCIPTIPTDDKIQTAVLRKEIAELFEWRRKQVSQKLE
jgi:hypothetical protein